MGKKVTIQDIADELGISRNTVSKAINNANGISENTRQRILKKAVELGYKQFSYVSALANLNSNNSDFSGGSLAGISGEIALMIPAYIPNNHFASTLLDKLHEELTMLGMYLVVHRITSRDIAGMTLPRTFSAERARGIVCVEVFNADYCDMICSRNLPTLFIDGPCRFGERSVQADMLLMDNTTEISTFIRKLIDRELTKIGFIGDYTHCQSFYERYCAFRTTMMEAGIPVDENHLILIQDKDLEGMADRLENLAEHGTLPDAFICANDFLAIDAMQLLAQKDRSFLQSVRFLGFDDSHESRIFYPAISTVHIHTQVMAFSALHLLVSRINDPTLDYRTIYVATDLVLRDSTEF
ncbi:MAG: LacI family DNA-binding transcriptional regulator [Solobacterium sp.]|nr:LacI family DNA-binding transcriptional regulator [Solobacterium sp.]